MRRGCVWWEGFLFWFKPYCSFSNAQASWITQEDSSVDGYLGLVQFAMRECLFKQKVGNNIKKKKKKNKVLNPKVDFVCLRRFYSLFQEERICSFQKKESVLTRDTFYLRPKQQQEKSNTQIIPNRCRAESFLHFCLSLCFNSE